MTNFAIIGCGHIAHRHLRHLANHPAAQLVGAYDVVESQIQHLQSRSEQRFVQYDNLVDLLDDQLIDIVNVCTPNGTHADLAVAVLKAGKHVLVEKPMATSKADCERMLQAALDCDKQLFVVKQNRFNPPVMAVKELLNQQALGKLYAVEVNCFWNRNAAYYQQSDWRGTKALDGGTLFTQFSHFVDILYYLFGDVEVLSGITQNVAHQGLIEFEDTGNFLFKLKKHKAQGSFNYTTACYQQNMEGAICIFAENATIKIGGKYLNVIDYQKTNGFDINDLPQTGPANDYGFYEGSMSNHDKVIHNVIETLNGRQQIMTNAYDGLKVVEIIENMYKKTEKHLHP